MIRELPRPRSVFGPGVDKPLQAKRFLSYKALGHAEEISADRVLQIGSGLGDVLFYLAESRDCKLVGLSTQGPWVSEATSAALQKNRQQQVRFFVADPVDPRSYRPFPAQDLVLLYDGLSVAGLGLIQALGASLRTGGRLVIAGLFRSSETAMSLETYPREEDFLATAEEQGFVLLSQEDLSSGIRAGFGDLLKAKFLEKSDPESIELQQIHEALWVKDRQLKYLLVTLVRS